MTKSSEKAQPSKLRAALSEVRKYFQSLNDVKEESSTEHAEVIIGEDGLGEVHITGVDADNYRRQLELLYNAANKDVKKEIISIKNIEARFKHVLLRLLAPSSEELDKSFEVRVSARIKELEESLTIKPNLFLVFVPVGGLNLGAISFRMGKVEFRKFDDEQLGKFKATLTKGNNSDEVNEAYLDMFQRIIAPDVMNKTVGIVEISAMDADAARSVALKELRVSIDAFNFYSDLLPYSHGYAFLPGDAERAIRTIPVLDKAGLHHSLQSQALGPLGEVSLEQLVEVNKVRQLGFEKVDALLAKERSQLSGIEKRLLAAIQWSGRATVDSRPEEAFLLYAISLESIILAEADKEELLFRLRVRIAHLLGKTLKGRQDIFKDVGEIYRIRSSIVHNGTYEVLEEDVKVVRKFAKSCIIKILTDSTFSSMTKPEELAKWFNEQILG